VDYESLQIQAFRGKLRISEDAGGRGSGGASRDRTDDLFHAMEALSQLSYSPVRKTLYLKGIMPPTHSARRLPVISEGRENTRKPPLGK
jgi:hypothetical protein